MNEFFTWSFLATFAGAALATGLITQFIKSINIPTQILSYIISFVVLTMAMLATGSIHTWADFAIVPINAILVSLSSNGAYTAISKVTGNN